MRAPDAVAQEDGYVSPTASVAQWDSPDISSPLRPGASKRPRPRRRSRSGSDHDHDGGSGSGSGSEWDEIDDAEVLSSSPVARTARPRKLPGMGMPLARGRFVAVPRALPLRPVVNTSFSSRTRRKSLGGKPGVVRGSIDNADGRGGRGGGEDDAGRGPNLQHIFDDGDWDWDEITSGGEDEEEHEEHEEDCEYANEDVMETSSCFAPGLITPGREDAGEGGLEEGISEELEQDAVCTVAAEAARHATVARGWWDRWARSGASTSTSTSTSTNASTSTGAGGNRNHSDHIQVRVRPFVLFISDVSPCVHALTCSRFFFFFPRLTLLDSLSGPMGTVCGHRNTKN